MLAFYFLRKDSAIMNNIEMIMASFQQHQGFLTFQQVLIASLILIWTNGLWRSNVFQKEFFL